MLEAVINKHAALNGPPMNELQVPLGWVETLMQYPKIMWGFDEDECKDWYDLLIEMKDFEAPYPKLKLQNTQRKWELVSAIQKSIRRGRYDVLSKLLAACHSQPQEMVYWWRRFTTTATEDIGPANITLMNMVIACEATFCKKANYHLLYPLMCFLGQKMCEGVKSRIFCSYSIIEHMPAEVRENVKSTRMDQLYTASGVYRAMLADGSETSPATKRDLWMEKNNWRGEKMGGYQSMAMPLMMEQIDRKLEHIIIGGLPNYCYDMHTMIGKRCLGQMRVNAFNNMELTIPTGELSADEQSAVLGWALFYAEGGLMDKELYDSELIATELACVAQKFRMSQSDLSTIIAYMLQQAGNSESSLNLLRQKIFDKMGYA